MIIYLFVICFRFCEAQQGSYNRHRHYSSVNYISSSNSWHSPQYHPSQGYGWLPQHAGNSQHEVWVKQRPVEITPGQFAAEDNDGWVLQAPAGETILSEASTAVGNTESSDGWVLQRPNGTQIEPPEVQPAVQGVIINRPEPRAHGNNSEPSFSHETPPPELSQHDVEKAGLIEPEALGCSQGVLGGGVQHCAPPDTVLSVSDSESSVQRGPNRYAFIGRDFVLVNEEDNRITTGNEVSQLGSEFSQEVEGSVIEGARTTSDETVETSQLMEELSQGVNPEQTAPNSYGDEGRRRVHGSYDDAPQNENEIIVGARPFHPRTDSLIWTFPNCPEACEAEWLGDKWCDLDCNVEECGFDDGDCTNWCSPGCPEDWVADGECDEECNIEECKYDGGDCESHGDPS